MSDSLVRKGECLRGCVAYFWIVDGEGVHGEDKVNAKVQYPTTSIVIK